jgi:serine/threonine protein kinase
MEHQNRQLREENTQQNYDIQEHEENNSKLSDEIRQLRQGNNNMAIEIERGTVTFSTNDGLGKGSWASVYKGDFFGTKVAVKQYHDIILSQHNQEILQREINIASQCRHPNLLQMICATRNERNCLLIVTELMDTSLRKLVEQRSKEKSQLEPSQIKSISLDVARGLNYLHSRKPSPIIHRDVSSANVLLWMENGSVRRAKLSDYGSANFMEACNTRFPGAAPYAAPEAKRRAHTPKVKTFESICMSLLK